MKKFILGIFIFLLTPIMASAASYDIENFYIRAYIQENGDMKVNEIMVLDGDFNGYERDLSYKPYINDKYETSRLYEASNIEDIVVKGKYISSFSEDLFTDTDYTIFNSTSYASNGDKGKYIKSSLNGGYRLRMYYKSSGDKVAFNISYTLKNVVVLHNDVAELYWPFIGEGFEDYLENIDIKAYLPRSDDSAYFRVWGHGVLYGDINMIDKRGAGVHLEELDPGIPTDIRITFDKSLITNTLNVKKSNINYFDKILEIEAKRAEDADKLEAKLRQKYDFVKYSTIGFYIGIVLLWIFVYVKFGKSPKSGYYSKYNREFIDDYNVEVIDYLMNKKITPNAMSASIMNLVYKKNINVEEIVDNKSKKKNYKFILENKDNINDSEEMLIEFLFDNVGKGKLENEKKVFTTIDLKKYADGTKTCNSFIKSYTKWKNNILAKSQEEEFYESFMPPKILGVIVFIISFMLFVFTLSNGVDFIPAYFVTAVGMLFVFYSLFVERKTKKGSEHYDKWKAFKNFLNDFGSFELKELPEIVLWERYLVYATIFGLADKVQKDMNVRINELNISNMGYDYYPSYVYINLSHSINTSINQALNTAYSRQAANYANTHSSSAGGSGFGGGFSGGSGFSGGGGGRGF